MKRMEIIFSQSIDEDFIQKCAEKDVGKFYTKLPSVLGKGFSEPKMGDSIWPQLNVMFIIYCDESLVEVIQNIMKELHKTYVGEGAAAFVSEANALV